MNNDLSKAVGRIKSIDGGNAYIEFRNGSFFTYELSVEDEFAEGDIVLIGPRWNDVEKGPSELWPEESWIGTVRLVLPDELIVVVKDRPRVIPRPSAIEIRAGNTVEGSDSQGVTRVLAEKPIPQIEVSVGESIDLEQFKFQPSESPSFEDFGGYEEIIERARELIEIPLKHHDALLKIGARPIKGVLFTGPPGTGKTMLARIIANQADAQFYQVKGPEIVSKWVGESEEVIRKIFEDATSQERAIIFFDEIDSVVPQRGDSSNESSRRIVGQLLALMDGFAKETNVVVIATTNRPQDIDVALRRPGRFDWEVEFLSPDEHDREVILATSASKLSVDDDLPHALIAAKTVSWTPAELAAIWSEAALLAVKDGRETIHVEDYFGGFERVSLQRTRVSLSKRAEESEVRR